MTTFNEEDRKWLYDTMQSKGVDTGSYDDFKNSLNNDEDRQWYYDKSKELGLDVGSRQDFDDMMWEKPQGKESPVQSKAQPAAGEPDGTLYSDEVMKRYNSTDNKAGNYKDLSQIAAEVAAEGGQAYTQAAGTPVADDKTPGSDLWRKRAVAIPGQNPYNGKSYGEVYDSIIQDFGKNINHPDIDPYAEARAQIIQAGITDDLKPEEADKLALDIRDGYANRFAGNNAQAIVSQLPDQVPNIDQLMDGMWYNRDMQDKISRESRRLGLSHENYVNFYMKPQIAKALSDRYGYDVNSAKHIAGRLLSGEQHTMERVRQGEANEMITRYAEPLVQPYFDRVFKDADQTFDRQLQTTQGSPTGGAGATMGASLNYYHNTDPVKVWGAMKPHIEEMARDIMNQDFILEADKRADEEGVTIDEWLKGRIEPYLLSGIQAKFEQMALEHEMPKNTMDYLMANIRQSLIGQLGNLILSSKARRRMQAEALARTEMEQGDYKPGFGARVAGGVAAMLPDMMYGGPFGMISKFATKGVQGMTQQLITDGMRPLFARMLQSSAQGALSLGAFEAVKGAGEGLGNDRFDSYLEDDQRSAGEILQDIVQGAYEHGMQSGIMGATMIGGPLGQKISNGRGILANVAGWGTQVGVDAATATALNIPKLISGEITMEDLGNEFAQNVGTFAALGLNHKAKEFASLANGGRAWNGVAFTKKDIDILEDRWLLPFRKQIGEIEGAQNRHGLIEQSSLGINASQELRDATNSLGAEMYRDLMHSYAVPRELKVKVSQALGVPIPEYALKPEVLQLEKDATAKSIDLGWIDAMNYDYNKPGGVADKLRNGEALNDSELTMRLLFQDNKAFNEALLKQQSGEPLTEQEQELITANQNRMNQLFQEYAKEESGRLTHLFEKEHDLPDGTLARMMKDAVEGKAVDNDLLNEYENMLRQYNSELDAASEVQREARQSSSEEAPVEEAPVAEAPVEEAPKVNRVEDEAPVEAVTDFTNKTTGTVMEVELIDGRKAYIVDGDPSDMNSMLSLVDEQGKPITMQDEGGYTHDKFPPEIIKADDKGMPVIRESATEATSSKAEEPATEVQEEPAAEESQVEGSALSRIPVDEKGEQVWEEASVEDTVAALREEFENDKEVAEMVDDEIADLTSQLKELTKVVNGKEKKHLNMNDRRKNKHAIKEAQQKLDYWNQVKEAMKSAEQELPVEEPSGKPADLEPEKPLEPEQPSEPQQPEQPAGPTAEQKIAQGTVKNNIGKRFGFQNPDGTRSEMVIDDFKGDDLVTVTRQDYDMNGQPKGKVYQQDWKLTDVGNSIVNGLIKPALTTKEKLGKQFKVTVGDIPLIDVLTEAEQQQLLDLYAKNDKEAIGRLTGDLIDAHHEDLILKGRDNRNQKVDQILNSNTGREKKLRQLRQLYDGNIVDSYLSDEALFPASAEEWVSELNSRVPKSGEGPLAYFSYDKDGSTVVGMQDETGFGTKSGGDNKGFAPWLAPEGKGMSLQRYGELLHSQLPENLQEQYSVQDMRNAVRDVFGSAERPSDIPSMIIRRGILQAENAARRMEEQWIEGGPSFHKVSADDNSFTGRLERAKQQTNTEPTDAQKEKGNYKKGHVSFGGYDFVVENPEGSMRRGEADGKKWEQKMNNTYGYILGKYGKDGDHLDMFINDAADLDNWNGKVYVVDQVNPKTGEFDEHKVMYGFDSEAEARDAYLSNYEKGWKGLGKITGVDKETFDSWLDSSKRKRIPFAEHSIPKEALAKQEKKPVTDAEIDKALMQEVMKAPAEKGVQFVTDVEKGQRVLDEYNGEDPLSKSKKRAMETASVTQDEEHQHAVISFADGAKVRNNLETLANNLEKVSNQRKNFIQEIGNALGAEKDGSKSMYKTFETKNGLTVTIRLADHNTTVSNFDNRNEFEGISIVVTPKKNKGITNDGKAHIVEYYYDPIKLRKADGKPLADIVKSIEQVMYSGEYKDTTGLAEREEVNADELRQYKQRLEEAKVTDDSKIGFQKVSDADELKRLDSEPTVKRYRAMQLIDGKLYPPMSAKVDGEMREPTEIGVWEKAEERPDLVKNGKFVLNKGQKGQSNVPAAYNPYFHTSTSGLNDQFTSAYKRPELVVVEVEIPESELTSGYKAEGAKDAVGDVDWHSGVVNGQLPADRQRQVTLSRYSKVNRIVPDSEVADMIAKQLEGTHVEVPYNVVTPALRAELEKRGVKISDKPAGSVTEDINGNRLRQQKVEQPVFISNALQAVEGIKQEKATPEQWLKMIEKAGGMKAAEDKWLGLRAQLEDAANMGIKSVTKDAILNYIRDHQVQVEETHYSEFDEEGSRRLADFNKEFKSIFDKLEKERNAVNAEIEAFDQEMYEKYGQGWANDRKQLSEEDRQRDRHISNRYSFLNDNDLDQLAFADMVEKYGEDFGEAFEVNYNGDHYELIPSLDIYDEPTDAAKHFLNTENTIHSTRLNYTTDGLKNKREIALTVPTIEPYNESDSVHFGDAGGGRTVAWVRFGDTVVKVGVEPKVVTEFEAPYRNVNGMEVYSPEGEKYGGNDYIVHGKIRTGEDKYVIVMRGNQVAAYDTFDEARDAMNQWYKDNNVGKPITGKVLVIDEIQSKRHQDARNQGYSNTEEIKRLERKLDELIKKQKEVTEKEKAIYDEIAATDEVKAMLDKNGVLKPEYQEEYNKIVRDNEELQRLSREWAVYGQSIRATRDDITYEQNNGVPDAPFEKNWHELAMKRMLRYAAENGYDKIAWTTGEQQAERYSLSKAFSSIEREDNPSINGRRFVFSGNNVENFVVDDQGKVIDSTISDAKGKDLSDLVGKDMAVKLMGMENGDMLEGENLRIGGEGMKGFYDDILPRFMNKYGKKWGVKVGEVELPGLEKSAQKMWSIDVTPEMKESVMQGQPMFFKTPDGQAYGFTYKGKIYVDPRIATSETPIHEYGHLWAEMKRQSAPEEWNNIKQALLGDKLIEPFIEKVKREYPELTGEGKEDDFVEEVLTQYSGKHGAEKLRKMAQEIKAELGDDATAATIAEAAVRRVKSILNEFWKGVCDMMGWQYTNAEDVADAVLRDMLNGVNPKEERVKAGRGRANRADGLKQRQLDTILKENPADDENMPGHTWIRTINDIKTFREAVDEDGYAAEEGVTPDFTADMVKDALNKGVVTVYSSKPIKDGTFVTPSKMEATNYAGGGKVYSKEVPLTDVAWIDPLQGQYAKVSDNIKSQKVDYSSEEEQKRTKTIFDATKKLFGTTYDIREGGYVLPDGTMPDFSGRHQVDNASIAADLRGRRSVDHRDIQRIAYELDGNTKTGIETDMSDFIRRGAIRIDDNAGAINLSVKPTNEQKKVLRQLISRNDGYVQVDFGDGWDSDHYVEYDGAKPSRILADIDRYFDEGIKPLGDAPKYQLVGRKGAEKADEAEGTTMRQDNMKVAEEMEKAGKDIRAIKLATGWERGKDGQWRYETVDADVDVLKKYEDRENDLKSKGIENPVFVLRLGKLLGDDNMLFKYYPEMRFTEVLFDSTMDTSVAGSADGENIAINSKLAHRFDNHELDNESMYGTLLHEVQHIIQAKEGFAQGGSLSTATTEAGMEAIMNKKERQRSHILKEIEANRKILNSGDELEEYAELGGFKTVEEYREHLNEQLDELAAKYDTLTAQIDRIYKLKTVAKSDATDLYQSLAGEVEARNVTERMGMSDTERRNNPAAKTEDVSREDQVVILDKGESNSIQAGTDRQSDTHSDNFKNFFGDWEKEPEKASKVVDKDGEPMVVYHQTGNDFTVFDPRHKGAGTNDYQLPFGIFMKPSARSIGVGGNKQMALYANIRKPLRVANRQELSRLMQSKVEGYKEALAEYERIDQEYSKKFDEAMKYDHERDVENWNKWKAGEITEEEYQNAISDTAEDVVDQWKEAQSKPIAKMKELVDDYFKNSEYDGIWIAQDEGSLGRSTETIIAFEPNQVKSATENNGDYNPENPDIRFQRVSPDSEMTPENEQYWKQWDAAMKKWKERNALPMDAQEPTERPTKNPDESMMDYVLRLANYNREKALWQTAPKLEDYHLARDDKKVSEEARENEKRYPESEHAKRWRIATDLARIRHAMSRQKTYDKATVKAVTDFAQDFMKMGFGDNLRRGEMERMLSAVKNATGAKDVKKHVDAIMNILVDNQLRNLDQQIVKLSSIKELRQTAQGVERQGKLELKGQKMIQSFREARESRMTVEEIKERMAEVMENIVKHPDSDDMWEQEYEGLVIALQYAENIDGSRQEFKALDDEYKDAVKSYKESGRSYQAQQELLESLDKAMLENKMERIGSFGDIIGRLEGNIAVSIEGAKEYLEREKQRVKHIQEMANFDLAGKDMGAQRKDTKGKSANFFLQPLATFEQMLKQFGARNANGEGYLYNYFMRNWMDATDKAYLGEKQAKNELDEKAREVFGKKVKRWSDLYKIVIGLPTMDVEVADQGDKKTFTLTQGNLLYIYMANKMNDGAMKLRKMGIDEGTVDRIKDFLDPRLVELGDWLQDEYLPGKRVAYNKVHERMFGAPMAAIDHYFPIKILSDARVQEQDVNVPDSETLPSTITGNIIKRRKNALPLDILNTDALSLAIEHIEDMEHWAAQAEWNRDVNALLSYTTFRNKVKNMKTIYGSGDALWNTFKDAAKMAAGTYNSSAKSGHIDKTISNIAKGVTAAKIAFRVYTAFKQTLSAPAFLHDVDLAKFAKYSVNPYGSWKWAMENMPVFRKRWESRQAGDTRLMDDPTDWKMWKNDVVQLASRWGMSPNALVDGVTCAVGARAIYESRLEKYQKMGVDEETAKKRALQDAEIGYNLTQQSSEGAFVSAIQKDRTVAANMLSVFRNSSMAYTRQWVDASRNLKHRLQKGYKEDSIGFMQKQFEEQFGMDEEQARQLAEAEYARAGRHDVARMLNMMFGVTIAWDLGASLPYLLIGDDDDTKEEMLKDALLKGLIAGPSEGFASGNLISDFIGRTLASEETRKTLSDEGVGAAFDAALKQGGDFEINPLPLMSDIQGMIGKLGYDKYAALQDIFNICMQSAVGVNPQTFTDIYNAIMDYAAPGWDGTKYTWNPENMLRAKELALFMMRLANAPTSSWRNKYIDELDMDVEDAKKLSYDEMAKRYAHYKHWKDSPFMGWLRGEEGRQEKMEKIRKQFDKAYQERMDRQPDSELKNTFDDTSDADIRKQIAKLKAKSMEAKDAMGTTSSKDEQTKQAVAYYANHRTWQDMLDDLELEVAIRKLPDGDKKRKKLEKYKDKIKDLRNSLGRNAEEDSKRMESIRKVRDEAIRVVHEEQ